MRYLSFNGLLNNYLHRIQGIENVYPTMSSMIKSAMEKNSVDFKKLLDDNKTQILKQEKKQEGTVTKDSTEFAVTPGMAYDLRRMVERLSKTEMASFVVPESLFVSLVSQYDVFVGNLMKAVINVRPDIVFENEKQINYSELKEFGSVEDIKEYIVNKEVEGNLRENHYKQLEWFENKTKIGFNEDSELISNFIELTERRNLFVHNDGVINKHYIKTCKSNGYALTDKEIVGKRLNITKDYFFKAYSCLFEMGVKICSKVWRRLIPEELELSDSVLNNISYNLIINEDYELAKTVLDFVCSLNKHSSQDAKLMLIINRAQVYKWLNDNQKCIEVLDSVDWSACSLKYKMVNSVLRDDYDNAVKYMKAIGTRGEIGQDEYSEWPVFKEFKKNEKFIHAYMEIFDKEFFEKEKIDSKFSLEL